MRNKLDNLLLSMLWILGSTLGACFWLNTRFGFNIFSHAHWQHLAYMQANQTPITTSFYISIVTSVFVTLGGLYLLLRPRSRKIKLPKSVPHTQQGPIERTPITTSSNTAHTPSTHTPDMIRPPRLNMPHTPAGTSAPMAPIVAPSTQIYPTPQITPPTTQTNDWPELREIFESAGYTIKHAPKIGTTQTALLAIGTGEQLWLGAVGISTDKLKAAVDTMSGVFSDTLDDIYININAFIISAPDTNNPSAPDILTFDSADALRNYINEHKNTPPDGNETESFEAFSSYISTVVDYLGKI